MEIAEMEEREEQWEYGRRVLESLLVIAIDGKNHLPTRKEFVLSEVINGAVAFVGGGSKIDDCPRFEYGLYDRGGFGILRTFFEYYEREMVIHSEGKIGPRVKAAIDRMVRFRNVDPGGRERPYGSTDMYMYFDFEFSMGTGICDTIHSPTFSLERNLIEPGLVARVREETLPSFSESERNSVEGISEFMKPFIERDLKYIKWYHER